MTSEQIKGDKVIFIKWRDAFRPASCTWRDKMSLIKFLKDEDFIIETVGWLVHEDDYFLTVCLSKSGNNNQWEHIERIPTGCVIERKYLTI